MDRTRLPVAVYFVSLMFIARHAEADINVIRHYRLGEDDAGSVLGANGNASTFDIASGLPTNPATKVGNTVYAEPLAPVGGSSLAMQFENVDSRYEGDVPSELVGIHTNFGFEAYIMADPFTAFNDARPIFLGSHGFPLDPHPNGMGLVIENGVFKGLFGDPVSPTKLDTFFPADPGVPAHVAFVIDGLTSTVYVNHVQLANGGPLLNLLSPADVLSLGNFADGPPSLPPWAGAVDEVRLFTFEEGQFQVEDLLSPVPEPSTLVQLAVSAAALSTVIGRRRLRR